MKLKYRRIGPGVYSADTPMGEALIVKGDDYSPNPTIWYLTYPGRRSADDFYPTLWQAREDLQHWVDEVMGNTLGD